MAKYILVVCLVAITVSSLRASYSQTACEGYNLTLECNPGYLLHIENANYGRQRIGLFVCPKLGRDWNVLCSSSNAITYLRKQCEDRSTCTIPANNSIFGDPCKGTYKYLIAHYKCLRFERACANTTLNITCPTDNYIEVVNANFGRTLPGNEVCPPSNPNAILDTNCISANSTNIVKTVCNNKNNCTVKADINTFGDACSGTLKYLQVTYNCI